MTVSLKLGGLDENKGPHIRRLNRLPIIIAIALVVVVLAVIVYGLTSRGLRFGGPDAEQGALRPATTDADQLKRGIPDGIIGEPAPLVQPAPMLVSKEASNPFAPIEASEAPTVEQPALDADNGWRARLEREQQEQYLRELQRQRMASLQADAAALDSPIAVDVGQLIEMETSPAASAVTAKGAVANDSWPGTPSLYAAAMQSGMQDTDPAGQEAKDRFFNQDVADLGYLPKSAVSQLTPYELKRGSVIPATLVTGLNSDLPGRLTAQVSQNVFDSATGRHLLIPQGSKLFGRYDSKVVFGQSRVLVIWTDIIWPDGSTLQIGGMAGTDTAGFGGFTDQVDDHLLQTFGSAVLVALIGAGTEMMLPQGEDSESSSAEDAARRSFAETFGHVSEQTVSKNLEVQPTLSIRPGYQFNVLVDQDLVFQKAYRSRP